MRFGYVADPIWDRVRPFLKPAIDWAGEFTETEIQDALARQEAQLWVAEDDELRGAAITKIRSGPRGRVCEIWLIGGRDHQLWLPFLERIEAAARDHGCIAIEMTGRRGWERLLPNYRRIAVVLKKDL